MDVAGCSKVDQLLEGKLLPLGNLVLTLPDGEFEIPQGNEQSLAITVTRRGEFRGDVILDLVTPAGVTTVLGGITTIDSITTRHSFTLRVEATVPTGRYQVSFRAYGVRVTEAKGVRGLNVIDAPRGEGAKVRGGNGTRQTREPSSDIDGRVISF